MRYVEAGPESRLLAPLNGVAGCIALALGVTIEPREGDWVVLPLTAAAFATLGFWDRKKLASAPLVESPVVEPAAVTLRPGLPLAVLVVLMTLVLEDAFFGAVLIGVGLGFLMRAALVARIEERSGRRVLRRLWAIQPRYAHVLKDTAAAQRNPGHAESPAARRAP